jgi:hypothetical protein
MPSDYSADTHAALNQLSTAALALTLTLGLVLVAAAIITHRAGNAEAAGTAIGYAALAGGAAVIFWAPE